MSQPTLQLPPGPVAAPDPDDLDAVPDVYRSGVTDAVQPFAGLGLHVASSERDRWVVVGLALLFEMYARTIHLQTIVGRLFRR